MESRFVARRKQLMKDAVIQPQVARGLLERLADFLDPYAATLGRSDRKEHMKTCMRGLLSDLERKNAESIAYLGDQDRQGVQWFVGVSPWDHEPMREQLCREVGTELGEADGVIVFDPSGFKKYGNDSVGVARQWLGRFGKVDNGQVGVYLGYVSRQGHALCDTRLYLPKAWTADRKRRKKCGVPKDIRIRTRQQLALEMLAARGSLLPHAWIAGDDEMGRSSRFRAALRALGEGYVLAVPSNTGVRDLETDPPPYAGRGPHPKTPFVSAAKWCEALPEDAWTRVEVRDGEKGPLGVLILKRRVQARTEGRRVGPEELLVVTRRKEGSGWHTDYHLSNAPADTPLEELARVAKAEHRIEDSLKRAKSEAGLADYEVRTWRGWHHHQTLSLIATWFLTREARRGEKVDAGDHGAAGAGLGGVRAA